MINNNDNDYDNDIKNTYHWEDDDNENEENNNQIILSHFVDFDDNKRSTFIDTNFNIKLFLYLTDEDWGNNEWRIRITKIINDEVLTEECICDDTKTFEFAKLKAYRSFYYLLNQAVLVGMKFKKINCDALHPLSEILNKIVNLNDNMNRNY
jgi:hypothetical protein